MSGFLTSILHGVLRAIPVIAKALRPARAAGDGSADGKRKLDGPLGESKAQRALRLEAERREEAAADAEITRRGEVD